MNIDILIATVGVFFGELYGNIVGGGSLVTQIALQNILEMDIKSAMALDNTAVIGSNIGMLIMLARKNSVKWWFFIFILFQALGAILGAWILVEIDPTLLRFIFLSAIILLVIKNLFGKKDKHKEKGFDPNLKNISLLCLAAIFMGAYNAAFVIGDWIIALMLLTSVFSIKYQNAVFLLVFSMMFSQPVAVYEYYQNDLIDLYFLIPMISATLIGGLISGYFLSKINSEKIEKFLHVLSILLVFYLIWGAF